MARTKRQVPERFRRWTPDEWVEGFLQRVERGLVPFEVSGDFRAGRLDSWDTRTSGGKSTKIWKRLAGKKRRRFHKSEITGFFA